MNNINEEIIKYSKELRLPVFRRDFKELAIEAASLRLDYENYLLTLMEREFELTQLSPPPDAFLALSGVAGSLRGRLCPTNFQFFEWSFF